MIWIGVLLLYGNGVEHFLMEIERRVWREL